MALVIRHNRPTAPPAVAPTTWPKLSNTGPSGTLTTYTGTPSGSTSGALIENKIINDTLEIYGSNIIIRNCRFQNIGYYGVVQYAGNNLRVDNCEFDGTGATGATAIAIAGGGTIIRSDFHGMVIAIRIWGDGVTITDSYIHDMFEPNPNPDARHFDGIVSFGSDGLTIINNAIAMPNPNGGTAGLFLTAREANLSNCTVRNNLLLGQASYNLYFTEEGAQVTSGILDSNYINLGVFGHTLISDPTGITQTGNIMFNDGPPTTLQGVTYPTFIPSAVQTWLAAT